MSKESQVRDTANAIKGIVKAVPVYQDMVQPAAREIGKNLETATKSVRLVLAPVAALVWGYEKIKDYVQASLTEKLKDIPKERLVTPNPTVAGPALEALKYAGHNPDLRELYSNLLATSIDVKTAHEAHPAFVEIIRQLTPDEARILKFIFERMYLPIITVRVSIPERGGGFDFFKDFSDVAEKTECQFANLTPQYLGNICRLGLAEFHRNNYIADSEMYRPLEKHELITKLKKQVKKQFKAEAVIVKEFVGITELGRQFCRVCVILKNEPTEKSTSAKRAK